MDDLDDWYYCLTLYPSLGSILAACSLIFIPWHIKDPGPRITLIKRQAIADIVFASSNVLVFIHPSACALPLGIIKFAKCLSILFAVILSLMHTNLFGLEPQTLAGTPCYLACTIIAFLCGLFSVFPFDSEHKSCISILNKPHDISRLLTGDGLVLIAVTITILAVCWNHWKSRSKSSIERSPLLLILIWIIDLIAIVVQYCLDKEIPALMIPKLLFTRSIGIANWIIYRKDVLSLRNPKQGLEKALECIGRSETEEAILITNQVKRFACQIHGFALLEKASRLQNEAEGRQNKATIEGLRNEGYEELHNSLEEKYYKDLTPEQVLYEESKDDEERQTTFKNEKVQKNEEKAEKDMGIIKAKRELENKRKNDLEQARKNIKNNSEDIEGTISLIKGVKGNDPLGLLAYQLHAVALFYKKNDDNTSKEALEEFEKSFEGSQEKPKPHKSQKGMKNKTESSFADNKGNDLTTCLIDDTI